MTAEHAPIYTDYPEYVGALPPPAARHRTGKPGLPAASVLVSLALHGMLLLMGAIVVYEAATFDRAPARDITINLDAPGQGITPPRISARPGESIATAISQTSSAPPPESPDAPVAPTLAGLSTFNASPPAGATLTTAEGALERLFSESGDPGSDVGLSTETVTFAGLGASSARSVVYAVDCSGPMVTSLPMVLAEVRRSVSRLSPTQKFGVILFRRVESGPAIDSFAPLLVRATPSAQDRLADWLGTAEPTGKSSPLAGLEAAIALHPDAIFLLSRAIDRSGGAVWDGGLRATMARLDELNPADRRGRRPVSIQTIQFLDEDPTGILQAIGTQHGSGKSSYRVIRRSEELSSP